MFRGRRLAACLMTLILLSVFAIVNAEEVIREEFTSGAGNFTVIDGTWGVVSGTYQITTANSASTTHLNNRSIHNTVVSGDFTLTADAKVTGSSSTWNDFAIIFGWQDANNYYFYSSNESNDGATSGVFKVVGGSLDRAGRYHDGNNRRHDLCLHGGEDRRHHHGLPERRPPCHRYGFHFYQR